MAPKKTKGNSGGTAAPSFRPGDRVVLLGDLDIPEDEQDVAALPDRSAVGNPRASIRTLFADLSVEEPACHVCGATESNEGDVASGNGDATGALMTCGGCHSVKYCGRAHQKEDWKRHKAECKVRAKGRQQYYTNMHGTVAKVIEPDDDGGGGGITQVVVDLDLSMERIRVSPAVLEREPPIPADAQKRRAKVNNGALVEAEGRAMDLVLKCLWCVTASTFMGMSNVNTIGDIEAIKSSRTPQSVDLIERIIAMAWSVWSDGRGFEGTRGKGSYHGMRNFVVKQLYERGTPRARRDPDILIAKDAVDDARAAKGWNVRVTGCFWVVGMDDGGTYLVPDTNRSMVFQCIGIRTPIYSMMQQQYPGQVVCVNLTMIPWYGRLVYDGVVAPPLDLPRAPAASEGLAQRLKQQMERAKRQGRVISRLAQLEVPGGSLQGLHDTAGHGGTAPPSTTTAAATTTTTTATATSPPVGPDSPPTPEELKLLDKLTKIRKTPGARTFDPMQEPNVMMSLPVPNGQWVFRRMGYTEIDNPNHMGVVINSAGGIVGPFSCSALKPTAADILKALIKHSSSIRQRPALIGIDDFDCHERVRRLLRHANVDATSTFYYPPATAEETASAMRQGPF